MTMTIPDKQEILAKTLNPIERFFIESLIEDTKENVKSNHFEGEQKTQKGNLPTLTTPSSSKELAINSYIDSSNLLEEQVEDMVADTIIEEQIEEFQETMCSKTDTLMINCGCKDCTYFRDSFLNPSHNSKKNKKRDLIKLSYNSFKELNENYQFGGEVIIKNNKTQSEDIVSMYGVSVFDILIFDALIKLNQDKTVTKRVRRIFICHCCGDVFHIPNSNSDEGYRFFFDATGKPYFFCTKKCLDNAKELHKKELLEWVKDKK